MEAHRFQLRKDQPVKLKSRVSVLQVALRGGELSKVKINTDGVAVVWSGLLYFE
tara:strand:+ start:5799 stop:5960 length:162 start_codon:yes stop_codon:yes gene_type:complete